MAIVFMEDTFGKTELVVFPKTYRKFSEELEEDRIVLVEGTLERRNGNMQVVVRTMQTYILEDFQEEVRASGLWVEGEKVARASQDDAEEEQVVQAEQVLNVKKEDEKKLADTPVSENKKVRQIFVNRKVDKAFFLALKAILEKHPGSESVELVMGDTILPLPIKVTWNADLDKQVNVFLDH